MPELLWILGVPAGLDVLSEFNKNNGFDWAHQLNIPRFPSASLDGLLEESDEVGRMFNQLDQMCRKMVLDMAEFPNLNFVPKVNGAIPSKYLGNFSWSESDYTLQRGSLHEITEEIMRSAHLAERGFREAYTKLTSAKSALNNAQKVTDGPLQTRSLTNIIYTDSDCWFESVNMTSIVCVVQRHNYETFIQSYSTYSPYIVPYSASLVIEDENSLLVTLIVMKEHLQEVISSIRKEKVSVRDFTPVSKDEAVSNTNAIGPLKEQVEQAEKDLQETVSDVYPALFKSLCYLSIIRAYIESTLKFGLRDSQGKEKGKLIIVKVTDHSERMAKQAVETKILKKLYIAETKVLGHDARVYDSMDSVDSFLPFVYMPLVLESGEQTK